MNKNLSYENPYSSSDDYRPTVPKWVAEILTEQRKGNPFGHVGRTKQWEEWKYRYSRKLKYARKNGWIVQEESE